MGTPQRAGSPAPRRGRGRPAAGRADHARLQAADLACGVVLLVHDAETGEEVQRLPTRQPQVLALSPGGEWLAVASGSEVEVYDLAEGRLVTRHETKTAVRAVAFDRHGKGLAAGGDDGFVRVWDFDARPRGRAMKRLFLGVRAPVRRGRPARPGERPRRRAAE